jgi:putative transposase
MRKRYSEAFKAQMVLELLKEEKTVAQIASEYHVHPTQLNEWKATALAGLPSLFTRDRKAQAVSKAVYDKRIEELYAEIGRLTTQVNWLKKKSGIEPDTD